ncbi:MAG: SLBB domain-containing protein [Dysgonomonas sp.]|nr:SLBB domain-containing protein [Dysgonomonas sp.]
MKKVVFCFIFTLISFNTLFAQMSDEQVVSYVQQEYSKGASQQEIATNLTKRGVTREQLERIKQQQEKKQGSTSSSNVNSSSNYQRTRTLNTTTEETDFADFYLESSYTTHQLSEKQDSIEVFGRNIFNTKNLTFNPDVNIPTPLNYRLGPGDEVIIDIWGASQTMVRQTISPEGGIVVDRLGPIYLNGMTVQEANDYVQRKFSEIYAGIDSGETSHIKLTLGQIRTIQINVMGEVVAPGTYSLSSLSSVFHALYRAGGVNQIGSLRSVKLYRNNKLLKTLDVYDFLLKGKSNDDIRLTDGDIVMVSPYLSLVKIGGNVKRPMYYEMSENETLEDLLNYAGGFTGNAYSKKISIVRNTGGESKIFTVDEKNYNSFPLNDNDIITIGSGLSIFENRVEIKGAVYRNGYYEIGNKINTVKDLILAADGVRGDAFLNRAVLTREKEDYTIEIISIDVRELLYGNASDIVLRKNDILYIPSINDINELGDLVIYGEVARPGEYKYADNTTLEDLIIQAGGLLESASVVRVDIARRIIDPKSMSISRTLSDIYSFSLKDGLIVDGEKGFVLKPYDQVYVRRSPGYREQQDIHVEGEVLFPGTYALNKKAERISDIVKRAGNLTPDAYAQGARLIRERSKEELFRSQTALKIANQGGKDSISIKQLDIEDVYNVGIELDKAIKNPGSDYDLVLRKGDKLIIPEYDNTVKINGAVMYPNTVVYKKDEKLSYYINQAGGYADNAKKNKSFVIYMNGTVSKVKSSDRNAIKPGSEIIIPSKEQARRLSISEVLSLGTSVTSMASLIGVLINTMK